VMQDEDNEYNFANNDIFDYVLTNTEKNPFRCSSML
jgi:hypothetical protein